THRGGIPLRSPGAPVAEPAVRLRLGGPGQPALLGRSAPQAGARGRHCPQSVGIIPEGCLTILVVSLRLTTSIQVLIGPRREGSMVPRQACRFVTLIALALAACAGGTPAQSGGRAESAPATPAAPAASAPAPASPAGASTTPPAPVTIRWGQVTIVAQLWCVY